MAATGDAADRQARIDLILDHFENPRHHGILPDATIILKGGNPGCGDVLTLYLKIDDGGGYLSGISFEGEGCTISQAAASMVAEMFAGAPLDQVRQATPQAILDLLGREIVGTRLRCATLAFDIIKSGLARFDRIDIEHGGQ